MSRWDILQKLFVTLSNCLLSNKVKTYNAMVLGHDNYKLKNSRTNLFCISFSLNLVPSRSPSHLFKSSFRNRSLSHLYKSVY